MAKILVPKAELAALVGLAPDVDDATLNRAINETIAKADAQKQAVRNRELEDADKRLVAAAVAQGKFPNSRSTHYLQALKADRGGATQLIAMLGAVPQIAGQAAVDPEAERVSAAINGRPYEPTSSAQAAVRVAAARAPLSPARDTGQPSVMTNEELNAQIESDPEFHRAVWAIGGPGGGLRAPAERMTAYPDVEEPWNPKPRLVDHGDGTSSWETPPADFTMGTGIATAEADQLARDLAHTYNIDLGTVKGTGARGRIKSSDVVEAARRAGRL